jgi:RND superfamily putative drug exporter
MLLGFTATLGATVFLFQGVEGKPGLIFRLPIFLYLFVMAIGTDDNILMIARLREEAREGHGPRRAAELAVQHAGPTAFRPPGRGALRRPGAFSHLTHLV